MKPLLRIAKFAKPCWKESVIALFLLTSVVFLDLVIPRLIQKIINQGEIVEQGDPAGLLASKGFYYHLYMSQFKGQEI